jgi:hypothetical protein
MPRNASTDIKCSITAQVKNVQQLADQRGSPTAIARAAKAISAQIDEYNEWTDNSWGVWGCPYSTSRKLVDQLAPLLLLGMARMTRSEAIAETTRESGIRTAVDTAGSTTHQALAEEVRQTARPQPNLVTQAVTTATGAMTGTAPAPKIPPEPVRVDFTNRVKYLEGQRRSFSTDKMIASAREQKALFGRTPIWNNSCGLLTAGCSGRYDSSVSLNSRLDALIREALAKQQQNANAAEREAAAARERAEREARSAASRERIATAQREQATTDAARAAAERRRVAAAQQRDAARAETERQRKAQETEMRRRRAQQAQQQSSGPTAREFQSAAKGVGAVLSPLADLFSNMSSQRIAAGQAQIDARRAQGRPAQQYIYQQRAKKSNTGLIIAGAAGGGILLLILLYVVLSGDDSTATAV